MAWSNDPGSVQVTSFSVTFMGDLLRYHFPSDNFTLTFGAGGNGLSVATHPTHTDILWNGTQIGTESFPDFFLNSPSYLTVSVDAGGAVTFSDSSSTLPTFTAQIPGTEWQTQDNTAYVFTGTNTHGATNIAPTVTYTAAPVCFARGTGIATLRGVVPVEDLRPGDAVLTADAGAQPVRWVGGTTATAEALATAPGLRPVRIRRGALGPGLPARDLLVSRQHRMVLRSAIVQRMFGVPEVLVPAKDLLGLDGVEIAAEVDGFEYWHILLDAHHIVFAEGAAAETLHPGPEAVRAMGPAMAAQVFALRPDLRRDPGAGPVPPLARPESRGARARACVHRHVKNTKPIFGPVSAVPHPAMACEPPQGAGAPVCPGPPQAAGQAA